jgi:hypothetical protein
MIPPAREKWTRMPMSVEGFVWRTHSGKAAGNLLKGKAIPGKGSSSEAILVHSTRLSGGGEGEESRPARGNALVIPHLFLDPFRTGALYCGGHRGGSGRRPVCSLAWGMWDHYEKITRR